MVEAHSLERGCHSLSSLQLNDSQRTNFRDKDGKPVMDCLGGQLRHKVYMVFEE